MQTVGVICEYNPFHLGHKKQLDAILAQCGRDTTIVCLMSGNFVQRGHPAVFDKMRRAEAALLNGADLVLELPVTYALSSAEGFAAGGVSILGQFCDTLCFGAETADAQLLMDTAQALLSERFSEALRIRLDLGLSFPAARQAALGDIGMDASLLETPNNILAVEYCKAIQAQRSPMQILPIHRGGNYHDATPDAENPSATAIRNMIADNENWHDFVPSAAYGAFDGAPIHTLKNGERTILGRLRTMTDEAFETLPYGSEGLWRKLMHACRKESDLEDILSCVKSKRYTRTRLDRMVMCAFLGITEADLAAPVPYIRVLGFNSRGRSILNANKDTGFLRNIGENTRDAYQNLERRSTALYGLFADTPESPDAEQTYRMIVK